MKSPYTDEASTERADQGPPSPSHQWRQRQVRLSTERVDELVELYRSGASKAELARVFGINETTVRAHLRRRAVEHLPRRKLHGELLEQGSRALRRWLVAAFDWVRAWCVAGGGEVGAGGCRR